MPPKEKPSMWIKSKFKRSRYFTQKAAEYGFPLLGTVEKGEIILEWYVNGGVVLGERYRKLELAQQLELSLKEFDELMDGVQKSLASSFDTSASVRRHVFSTASKLSHQIQEDRARAIENDEAISKTLGWLYRELENMYSRVPKNDDEKIVRDQAIQGLLKHIKSFHYHRTEALKVVALLDDGCQKYLSIYVKDKENMSNPLTMGDETMGPGNRAPLTYEGAIALIEDSGAAQLPRQQLHGNQTKNPVAEFSKLMRTGSEEDLTNGAEFQEQGKTAANRC